MAMASSPQHVVASQAPTPTDFDAQGVSSSSGTADSKIETQVQALERQLAQLQVKARSSIATAALMAQWTSSSGPTLRLQPCSWLLLLLAQCAHNPVSGIGLAPSNVATCLHLHLHQLMGKREVSHPV